MTLFLKMYRVQVCNLQYIKAFSCFFHCCCLYYNFLPGVSPTPKRGNPNFPAFHAESAGANQRLGSGRSMISNLDGIANIADGQQNEVRSVLHPKKMQESSKVHAGVAFGCTFVVHYTNILSTYHYDIVQMTKRIAEICNFPTHRC